MFTLCTHDEFTESIHSAGPRVDRHLFERRALGYGLRHHCPQVESPLPTNYRKLPLPVLLTLTVLPALMIGATFWVLADLIPGCSITETQRQTAPDQQFDLVVFSRTCGEDTEDNRQAALIPPGESLAEDATSFFAAATTVDLTGQWIDKDNLTLTVPAGTDIRRQDKSVASVTVTYR